MLEPEETSDETGAQLLRLVDDHDALLAERDAAVARLEALAEAARVYLAEVGVQSAAGAVLEGLVRNAYPESDGDPDTVVPVEPRPFQVGDRVTFTDEDGSVWPGCTVRAPMAPSFHAGKFRIDNGNPEIASLSRNGFTFSTYAHPSQMVLEVPNV